jgi:two-component system sensor histidine kinase BaeS
MLVTVMVALVSVLVTGLVLLGLIRGAAEHQARVTLGRQADLAVEVVDRGVPRARQTRPGLRVVLAQQGIELAIVRRNRAAPARADPADVSALAAGRSVSAVRSDGDRRVFVEGRPDGEGGGVLLYQAASVADEQSGRTRRLVGALVIGMAGGALAGVLAARRLVRPLQRAAAAAHRLSTGARDVRLDPEGPAEVAEVAEALNGLTKALAASEGRQRQFLLSVSHELRTPLTAVRGYAEALADGVIASPDDVRRTGATVRAEASRLERLVSDLLDLARLGADDFRLDVAPVDLAALVRMAGTVWRDRCAREGIGLRVEVPDGSLVVDTDATRVRQIIDGLAENALRVTPAGAPIVLGAGEQDGSEAFVEVRDGGPGLTADDLAVAFEPGALYERYRGVRTVGTGVGLALVARLAARLGGRAVAGVAPEGGARFAVYLPPAGRG